MMPGMLAGCWMRLSVTRKSSNVTAPMPRNPMIVPTCASGVSSARKRRAPASMDCSPHVVLYMIK